MLSSLIVTSYYSSFVLAASVMLHKHFTTPDSALPWGPFKLGRAGVPVTVVAIVYSTFGAFFSVWPTTAKPDAQSMNYDILVFGATIIFSLSFWFFYGRKYTKGLCWLVRMAPWVIMKFSQTMGHIFDMSRKVHKVSIRG